RRLPSSNPPGGIYPCKPGGPNDYVFLMTSRANPEHWPRLLKLIGREDLIGDPRYDTADARLPREAEVDELVAGWTRQRTKHEAMAQLSAVGVPAGAVLDSMDLVNEPSFRERVILQTMTHGGRNLIVIDGSRPARTSFVGRSDPSGSGATVCSCSPSSAATDLLGMLWMIIVADCIFEASALELIAILDPDVCATLATGRHSKS